MDRVSQTQKLRKQYTDANTEMQMQGQSAPDWSTWVQGQGYTVGPDGLVNAQLPVQGTIPVQNTKLPVSQNSIQAVVQALMQRR